MNVRVVLAGIIPAFVGLLLPLGYMSAQTLADGDVYFQAALIAGIEVGEVCAGPAGIAPTICDVNPLPGADHPNDTTFGPLLSWQDNDIDCGLVSVIGESCAISNYVIGVTAFHLAAEDSSVWSDCSHMGRVAGDGALMAGASEFVAAQIEDFIVSSLCPANYPDQDDVSEIDIDADDDGAFDLDDNCPATPNPGQQDTDNDGPGDACDPIESNSPWHLYLRSDLIDAIDRGETCTDNPVFACELNAFPPHQDGFNTSSLGDNDIDCGLTPAEFTPCAISSSALGAVVDALAPEAQDTANTCAELGALASTTAVAAGETAFVASQYEDYIANSLCPAGFPGAPAAAADTDGDGIDDAVDTEPGVTSNDFSDGTTTGTIVRGGQTLTVTDEPAPDGVRIAAAAGGPARPPPSPTAPKASTR